MTIRSLVIGVAGALMLAALTSPAAADQRAPCFFVNQWDGGWHATNDHTIYIRVNLRDIYRIDLSAGSQELTWPGYYHLISRIEGSDSICGPLDLQLALSDGHGFYQPLIAKDLVKLTPEEIKALPRKDLP